MAHDDQEPQRLRGFSARFPLIHDETEEDLSLGYTYMHALAQEPTRLTEWQDEPELFRDGESLLHRLSRDPDFPTLTEIQPGVYYQTKFD